MSEEIKEQHEYRDSAAEALVALQKTKRKISLFFVGLVVFVIAVIGFIKWKQTTEIDYIDGNVLMIAQTGQATVGNIWKNDSFIAQLTFASLFETDASFTEVNPYLGESIQVSPDGLNYTIVLKDGLKWSDGSPLTVDDVIFSIETFLLAHNDSVLNLTLSGAFSMIEGVAVRENPVYHFKKSIYIFSTEMTQFVILQKGTVLHLAPSTYITELPDFL